MLASAVRFPPWPLHSKALIGCQETPIEVKGTTPERSRTFSILFPWATTQDQIVWSSPAVASSPEKFSQPLQACRGVTELLEFHSHAIHEGEIQAAHFPIVVAGLQVVQRASCFESATQPSSEHERQSRVVVLAANPHVREEHQARVIQHGAGAFRPVVQSGGQISELAQVKTRDAFVTLGLIFVRRGPGAGDGLAHHTADPLSSIHNS